MHMCYVSEVIDEVCMVSLSALSGFDEIVPHCSRCRWPTRDENSSSRCFSSSRSVDNFTQRQIGINLRFPQEQLQINLVHQTQLAAGPGKPSGPAMQQLQQHQQQLVAQMQMTQQALMLGQSIDAGSKDVAAGNRGGVRERHMSETTATSFGSAGSSDGSLKENRPDNNNGGGDLFPATFKLEQNGKRQT